MHYPVRPLPQRRREREGTGRILPYDGSFSLYLQGRGNRADASAKVVTDNETDCVFSGGKFQGAVVGHAILAKRRQLLRGQMSLNFLSYGMIDRFAFRCFRQRHEVESQNGCFRRH